MYLQNTPVISMIVIKTNDIWRKKEKFAIIFYKNFIPFVKWHPLKQTKLKNGHHFWRPTFLDIELCCLVQKDSTALKLLKSHFASTEHGSVSLLYIKCAMFFHKKWWIINYYHKIHPWSQKNWHALYFLFGSSDIFPHSDV